MYVSLTKFGSRIIRHVYNCIYCKLFHITENVPSITVITKRKNGQAHCQPVLNIAVTRGTSLPSYNTSTDHFTSIFPPVTLNFDL